VSDTGQRGRQFDGGAGSPTTLEGGELTAGAVFGGVATGGGAPSYVGSTSSTGKGAEVAVDSSDDGREDPGCLAGTDDCGSTAWTVEAPYESKEATTSAWLGGRQPRRIISFSAASIATSETSHGLQLLAGSAARDEDEASVMAGCATEATRTTSGITGGASGVAQLLMAIPVMAPPMRARPP
jgi:hypothetical protein